MALTNFMTPVESYITNFTIQKHLGWKISVLLDLERIYAMERNYTKIYGVFSYILQLSDDILCSF